MINSVFLLIFYLIYSFSRFLSSTEDSLFFNFSYYSPYLHFKSFYLFVVLFSQCLCFCSSALLVVGYISPFLNDTITVSRKSLGYAHFSYLSLGTLKVFFLRWHQVICTIVSAIHHFLVLSNFTSIVILFQFTPHRLLYHFPLQPPFLYDLAFHHGHSALKYISYNFFFTCSISSTTSPDFVPTWCLATPSFLYKHQLYWTNIEYHKRNNKEMS